MTTVALMSKKVDKFEGISDLAVSHELMVRMGYSLVHTWYESHGDGGQRTYQMTSDGWYRDHCPIIVVSYNREGKIRNLQTTSTKETGDYVLAKQIELESKTPNEEGNEWVPKSRDASVSPCFTEMWKDYQHVWRKNECVRYSSVAGHGSVCKPISRDEFENGSRDPA